MGGGVDAAGEAGDDDEARGAEVGREDAGHLLPGGRGVAGADDGDGLAVVEASPPAIGDQRRRAADVAEQRRDSRARTRRRAGRRALPVAAISSSASAARRDAHGDAARLRRGAGRASSAASAEPSRLRSWRKVCGPTLSVRMSRSQATRCASVSVRLRPSLGLRLLAADLRLGAGPEAPRYWSSGGRIRITDRRPAVGGELQVVRRRRRRRSAPSPPR